MRPLISKARGKLDREFVGQAIYDDDGGKETGIWWEVRKVKNVVKTAIKKTFDVFTGVQQGDS
jgi:hypothetical protein